jgi:hypothetical protein
MGSAANEWRALKNKHFDADLLLRSGVGIGNEQLLLKELEAEVRRHLSAVPTEVRVMMGPGGDKSRVASGRFLASK